MARIRTPDLEHDLKRREIDALDHSTTTVRSHTIFTNKYLLLQRHISIEINNLLKTQKHLVLNEW